MPFRRRTLPPFTFALPSSRDSFTLPDYYRSTRLEQYGPYYRSSEPIRELMKTIDLRGRESPDSICVLPDNFEDDELELDTVLEVGVKLEYTDDKSVHDDHGHANKHPGPQQKKRLVWLWRLLLSMFRRCHGHRADPEKSAGRSIHFSLSE